MEKDPPSYWPPGIDEGVDIHSFVLAVKTEGFDDCADGEWEDGYRKIVLTYHPNRDDEFGHACVLVRPGVWLSKWGEYSDFEHALSDLDNSEYGSKYRFLRKSVG